MIKVTTQGGKTQSVQFKDGMLVSDVLKLAKIELTIEASITVNNEDADLETKITDNDLVVLIPKVSNG